MSIDATATEQENPKPLGERPAAEVFDSRSLRGLNIPALVSAVANLLAGFVWFHLACLGFFVTTPLLVLGAFEVIFFARSPQMRADDTLRNATVLGVFEILLGIFNLGVSLVCGILVLLQVGKLRPTLAGAPPPSASKPTPEVEAAVENAGTSGGQEIPDQGQAPEE